VDMKGEDALPPQQYSTVTDREYIWGPGGVDELVCQIYDSGARAYALLDIGGNVTGLVNSTGGLIEQYVYDPYGQALLRETPGGQDPRNRIGHKGLFFDRLDADTTAPQLAPSAFGLYQNRNRTFAPGIGRFLQRDPNASGQPTTIGAFFGAPPIAANLPFDPDALYADGLHSSQYLGSSPALRHDPRGLFLDVLFPATTVADIESDWHERVLETGRSMADLVSQLTDDYSIEQEVAADWALDWSQDDDMGPQSLGGEAASDAGSRFAMGGVAWAVDLSKRARYFVSHRHHLIPKFMLGNIKWATHRLVMWKHQAFHHDLSRRLQAGGFPAGNASKDIWRIEVGKMSKTRIKELRRILIETTRDLRERVQ
jgi:hypothetical protein